MKKRLLFNSLYFYPPLGGAERSELNYLKALKDDYDILALSYMENGFWNRRNEDIEIDGVQIKKLMPPMETAFLKIVEEYRPDVVITQLLGSDRIIYECNRLGIKVIYKVHSLLEDVCKYHFDKCGYNDLGICEFNGEICKNKEDYKNLKTKYEMCSHIVFNSEYTKKIFNRFFGEFYKTDVIIPNFDYDIFNNYEVEEVEKDYVDVLCINSSITKGRDLIVELARRHEDLHIAYVDCRFPDINLLKSVKNIKIFGKVTRENLSYIYKQVDVVLMPTMLHETFSGVVHESLLCGTPVVASDKGCLSEIIKNGENGYIVDGYDDLDLWYQYIKRAKNLKISKEYSDSLKNKLINQKNNGINKLKQIINGFFQDDFILNDDFEEIKNVNI